MAKIFIFLLSTFFLFGADLNKTIVDGNNTIYNSLLKELKDKNQTQTLSLQKTLLEQLIKNSHLKVKTKTITKPQNIDDYKNLFIRYIDTISKINTLKLELLESQKKLNTIKNEISSLPSNSKNLLTLNLQYAFYKQKINLFKKQIKNYPKEIKLIENYLSSTLNNFFYEKILITNNIKSLKLTLNRLQNSIERLKIAQEQAELINNKSALKEVQKELKLKIKSYKSVSKEILANNFLLFSSYLKQKSTKAFKVEKEIKKLALNIIPKDEVNSYLSSFLLSLEKSYLGQIKTITTSGKEELKDILYKSWEFINRPIFTINQTDISILKIVLSLFIFIIGFLIGAFYKRKINTLTINHTLTPSTKTIILNLGYYLIITIAFFIALNTLGVKLSSIALVAGALSVGIGFGLQNIVSNFVSGLILMFERSIKIGDFIELDENTRGYVTDIRMRSTTINTNDNIDIIVPNQSFIQNNVINWTMSDNIRRFSVPFGVAYGSDVHKVIKVVKEAILNSHLKRYIIDTKTKETKVIMTEMADSSVNFELLVWIKGDMMRKPKRTKSEFLIIIYDALYANNIEIPFPQQDIHIRSISKEIPITIKKSCND